MKKTRLFFAVIAASALAVSCLPDQRRDYNYESASVTMRPQDDKTWYLKSDEETALVVVNSDIQNYPFDDMKERRAIVAYRVLDTKPDGVRTPKGIEKYKKVKYAGLEAIDTVLISSPVPTTGDDDKKYGSDPFAIIAGPTVFPTTCIEDGYFNLVFTVPINPYAAVNKIDFYLVTGTNPDDPYELVLHHDAHEVTAGTNFTSIVAFSLKDLPPTGGKTEKLTVKWLNSSNLKEEKLVFDYKSREDW